jgi:hypothetical protein
MGQNSNITEAEDHSVLSEEHSEEPSEEPTEEPYEEPSLEDNLPAERQRIHFGKPHVLKCPNTCSEGCSSKKK